MIRLLCRGETNLLLEGGTEFFSEGKMPGGFEPKYFSEQLSTLIKDGIGHVAGAFGDDGRIHGALSWVTHPGIFAPGLWAIELFWFMRPEFRGKVSEGVRLVNFFETYAKAQGVNHVAMIHLENLQPEKLEQFYLRRGYRLVERHYVKDL